MSPSYQESRRFAVLLLAMLVVCLGRSVAEAELQDLQGIVNDWQQRQDRVRTVKYVIDGEVTVPKGSLTAQLPPGSVQGDVPGEDYTYRKQLTIVLDFEHNWASKESRQETFNLDVAKFVPEFRVGLFDGSLYQSFRPRADNSGAGFVPQKQSPELYVSLREGLFFEAVEYPLFLAHGIIPRKGVSIEPRRIRIPIEPATLHVQGEAVRNGRTYIVLRTSPISSADSFYEFWVDTARGSSIVRWSSYARGYPTLTAEIEHHVTADGWFPQAWTMLHTDRAGKLEMSHRLRVNGLVLNLPLRREDFHVDASVGTIIYDGKTDKLFKAGKHGELAEEVSALPEIETRSGSHRLVGALAVGALVGLAVAVILGWWRSRSAKSGRT